MKVINPISITSSKLDSSNVPLPDAGDPAIWNVATSYVVDDVVYDDLDFFVYVAVQAQAGNQPSTDDGTNWRKTTATNRYKMFNAILQDQTTVDAAGPTSDPEIVVTITPTTIINGIALLNLSTVKTVQVVMNDPTEGEVYNQTRNLTDVEGVLSWWLYYFQPISEITTVIFSDLPAYYDASITITITGPEGGSVGCGECVLGPVAELGQAQYGATFGIIDFSKKTTDTVTGLVTIEKGPNAVTADIDVIVDTNEFTTIKKYLESIISTPVVWIPDENRTGTIVYGYFREFDVVIQNFSFTRTILEIEGLV